MKNIYLTLIISFAYLMFGLAPSYSQETKLVASCCEGETGRCTGSSYCTACKNCRYCNYCNSGGSCGVCSGGSKRTTTYSPKRTTYPSTSRSSTTTTRSNINNTFWNNSTTSKSTSYNLPNDIYSEYYLKTLMVNTIALNLRAGPGTEYTILEKLNKYQELIFLAMTENWVKIKVKSTGTIGFVHYKYVVVLND